MAKNKSHPARAVVSNVLKAPPLKEEFIDPSSEGESPGLNAEDDGDGEASNPAEAVAVVRKPRVYKGTQELDHDLFKLQVAVMKKNVSFTDMPKIEEFEHAHIYHTVDSNGKPQTTCSPVGGHFHEIKTTVSPDGVPSVVVGPPRKWVLKKVYGRKTKVMEPISIGHEGEDRHTHKVEYLGSERIKARKPNIEFAKLSTEVRTKESVKVEGTYEKES